MNNSSSSSSSNSTARLRHHFSLIKAHRRDSYETLPDSADDDDNSTSLYFYSRENLRRGYRRCLALALALGLILMWCVVLPPEFIKSWTNNNNNNEAVAVHHKEIIPTLLQVVDFQDVVDDTSPSSSQPLLLVYALDNPLYDRLAEAVLHNHNDATTTIMSSSPRLRDVAASRLRESPFLQVDLHHHNKKNNQPEERPPDAVTLRWNLGVLSGEAKNNKKNQKQSPLVADEHAILTLECGVHDDQLVLLDAATVPQARATHRRNVCHDQRMSPHECLPSSSNDNNSNDKWYIPIPSHAIRHTPNTANNNNNKHNDDSSFYCRFRLYDATRPINFYLLAETEPLPLAAPPHEPLHIHSSWTTSFDSVVVQFVTAASGTPVVEWTTAAGVARGGNSVSSSSSSSSIIPGSTTAYAATDLCQAPANTTAPGQFQSPGFLHTVTLTGLSAHTTYSYRVGLTTGQGVTWSQQESAFTTALEAGDATPHAYLVYGDQGFDGGDGWSAGATAVTVAIAHEVTTTAGADDAHRPPPPQQQSERPRIRSIHHIGDLSYAQGAAHQWDQWFHMIQPFTTQVPLMVALGNHEYDHELGGGTGKDPSGVSTDNGFHPDWGNFGNDSGGECGVPVAQRFTMPANGNGVFWYSYDCGLVHTIVVSSEHDLGQASPQYQWLENDLRHVQRQVTPWVILETHRPLYEGEIFWSQNSVGVAMRMEIEDLLYDYQVDAVFAGHYHAYHRTCDGLYQGRCDSGGPMHLTIGTAGAHLDESDMETFVNPWTAKVLLSTYGYGRVTVQNATALHFEFVQAVANADNKTAKVLDDIWILRDR